MISFQLEDWRAWAPGLESNESWQDWSFAPHAVADDGLAQPTCAFLPTMQRRRLSRLARMTMEIAWPLCHANEQLPFVFASRYGETSRMLALLSDITETTPLSPTAFGLSVHNAIAGQWSILREQYGESTAIAGEADTFEHAILEGALQLQAGASAALVVLAEERPPSIYTRWITDVPFSYALALRLAPVSRGPHWQLQLEHHTPATTSQWPHALNFLYSWLSGHTSWQHPGRLRSWRWQYMD